MTSRGLTDRRRYDQNTNLSYHLTDCAYGALASDRLNFNHVDVDESQGLVLRILVRASHVCTCDGFAAKLGPLGGQ